MSNYYYGQSSSSTSNQSESSDSNVETKLITVQAKSSSHPYFSQGSSKGYFIDGKESPSLILRQNVVYRFDQSDSSNTNHFGVVGVFELDLGDSEIPLTPK